MRRRDWLLRLVDVLRAAERIRAAIRKVVLERQSAGPVAIWDGEPRRASVEHDVVRFKLRMRFGTQRSFAPTKERLVIAVRGTSQHHKLAIAAGAARDRIFMWKPIGKEE